MNNQSKESIKWESPINNNSSTNRNKEVCLKFFPPTEVILCYFDVLGFKGLFKQHCLEEIATKLKSIVTATFAGICGHDSPLKCKVFSDSFIIWTEHIDYKSFHDLCRQISIILWKGFLSKTLPIRASISHGDCVLDPPHYLFLGQPFIKAYEKAEEQAWVGGRIVNGDYSPPNDFIIKGIEEGYLVKWKIPIKKIDEYKNTTIVEGKPEIFYENGIAIDMTHYVPGLPNSMKINDCGNGAPRKAEVYWDNAKTFVYKRMKTNSKIH